MKLLIIGHSVLDYVDQNDKIEIQPGGIFYTASGFASQMKGNDEFFLATLLDNKTEKYFMDTFSKFNLKYSYHVDKVPEVHLKIWADKEREEKFKNSTEQIALTKISDFNVFDGILINMISGNDISLCQLKNIRKSFLKNIYFDVHALSKGATDDGKRILRKIPNMQSWLKCIDFLQVNEFELDSISEGADEFEKAKYILGHGPEIVIITKGHIGARIYCIEQGEIVSTFIAAESVDSVNKIGCGDIFGAYFFYTYIKTQNLLVALQNANSAAATSTTYNSTKKFMNLKNDIIK